MGYIYLITNKINNCIYVGKTIKSIQSRWRDHVSSANTNADNYFIHRAIKKYGEENFLVEQLEECDNSILSEREIYWIDKKKSYYLDNKKGYNLTRGGEGVLKYSDEEILELWDKGLNLRQISELLEANIGTISQRLQILLPGAALERKVINHSKKVLQYDFNGNFIKEWSSAAEAEKSLSLSGGCVSRACNKERHFGGNYLWKYKDDEETTILDLMIYYAKSRLCAETDLVDKDGNIIKTYKNPKEAELELKLPRGKVSEVCWHKRNNTGGYKFEWHYPIKKELAYGRIE